MPDEPTTENTKSDIRRSDDFYQTYANNIQLEISAWDLKIIFGTLEQHEGKVTIEQHTAVTIPWMQAKLLIYFLQINLAAYEAEAGKVKILPRLLPMAPPPLSQEMQSNLPAKELSDAIQRLYEQFNSTL